MKKILKLYQQTTCTVESDVEYLVMMQDDYKMVKKYFDREINLEDFMSEMFGTCPLNACHWCNNCGECDLYETSEEGEDLLKKCTECWRRCLEQEEETVGLSEENNKYVDLNQLKRLEKIYNNFDGCDDFEEARQEGKLDLIKELIKELENKK